MKKIQKVQRMTIDEVLALDLIKLDLGGGDHPAGGYINVDIQDYPQVHLIADVAKLDQLFPLRSVDGMMCRDTLQCFRHTEVKAILKSWHRVLKPRSRMVIQCYDINKIVDDYDDHKIDADRLRAILYGSQKGEYRVFQNCFTEEYLTSLLEATGFDIQEVVHPPMRIKVVATRNKV